MHSPVIGRPAGISIKQVVMQGLEPTLDFFRNVALVRHNLSVYVIQSIRVKGNFLTF